MAQTNDDVPGNGTSGMGTGMFLGLVTVVGFLVWYFLLQGGSGGGSPTSSSLPSLPAMSVLVPSAIVAFAWRICRSLD